MAPSCHSLHGQKVICTAFVSLSREKMRANSLGSPVGCHFDCGRNGGVICGTDETPRGTTRWGGGGILGKLKHRTKTPVLGQPRCGFMCSLRIRIARNKMARVCKQTCSVYPGYECSCFKVRPLPVLQVLEKCRVSSGKKRP